MAKTVPDKSIHSLTAFCAKYKTTLTVGGIVLFTYVLLSAVGMGCPIQFFTGISCAGCGMTRACLHALRLDFAAAFAYHPLWLALPVAAFLLILFKVRKMERAFWAVLYVFAGAMLGVYVFRLFLTDSDIVVWAPESGFVYRLAQTLLRLFQSK